MLISEVLPGLRHRASLTLRATLTTTICQIHPPVKFPPLVPTIIPTVNRQNRYVDGAQILLAMDVSRVLASHVQRFPLRFACRTRRYARAGERRG